jgi:predicted MPP superfamily phosphohydrolase
VVAAVYMYYLKSCLWESIYVALQIYFLWYCWIVCGVGRGHSILVLLSSREFLSHHKPSLGTDGRRWVSDQFFRGQYGLDRVSSQASDFNGSYFSVCLGGDYLDRSGRRRGHVRAVNAVLQGVSGIGPIYCVWSGHWCGADHFGRAVDFEHCRPSCLQKETSTGRGVAETVASVWSNLVKRVQVQALEFSKSQTICVRPGYLRVGTTVVP